MPYLVRENLFIGNIGDAAEVLQNGSTEVTHILSVLNSPSISFFAEWRSGLTIPAKEIKKVYVGSSDESASMEDIDTGSKSSLSSGKLLYSLEYAGKDLKLVRMAVPIKDMESENLLDYLDVCLDFIVRSRKEGSVLVHCFAGVSRSYHYSLFDENRTFVSRRFGQQIHFLYDVYWVSKLVDTYSIHFPSPENRWPIWLITMKRCVLIFYLFSVFFLPTDALESLKQSCEFVCPNDGFLDQLKLFEEMGFKVNRTSSTYKRFRLKALGDYYNRGGKIDNSIFGADPGIATGVSSEAEAPPNNVNKHSTAYRCKKCRRVVAMQENVVDHAPGEGETSFTWNKRKSGNPFSKSDDEPECSSIFVEPLRWMTAVEEGALEGKLSCVHCESRLGYFNWSGVQCSCGSWITPAFQIHKSRVDISSI